ncbi:MAG: shikimate dehydrogenase [Flavobacteriales bacterium]|nr:shikimate dehydrogenase [Flavobacteriales bacterium]|tara:strand:+ start:1437 stop:2183 length:747 start_codon:yes stop_codon:yes gene_type:complete
MQHKKFGLIGKSLAHSFSKNHFENKFRQEGLNDYQYDNYEIENTDELKSFLESTNCLGLNVTIPYKEDVITFLGDLDPVSSAIGAVNTLKKSDNGEIIGFNTDVIGFDHSLDTELDPSKKALILGSGGASKAIIFALNNKGINCLSVSRSPSKEHQISYEQLANQDLEMFELIVNCTPIGTYPNINEAIEFPYDRLNSTHYVYDLIYNPERSLFLQRAKKQGAKTQNGRRMLELQAEASWKIWHDQTI